MFTASSSLSDGRANEERRMRSAKSNVNSDASNQAKPILALLRSANPKRLPEIGRQCCVPRLGAKILVVLQVRGSRWRQGPGPTQGNGRTSGYCCCKSGIQQRARTARCRRALAESLRRENRTRKGHEHPLPDPFAERERHQTGGNGCDDIRLPDPCRERERVGCRTWQWYRDERA